MYELQRARALYLTGRLFQIELNRVILYIVSGGRVRRRDSFGSDWKYCSPKFLKLLIECRNGVHCNFIGREIGGST